MNKEQAQLVENLKQELRNNKVPCTIMVFRNPKDWKDQKLNISVVCGMFYPDEIAEKAMRAGEKVGLDNWDGKYKDEIDFSVCGEESPAAGSPIYKTEYVWGGKKRY